MRYMIMVVLLLYGCGEYPYVRYEDIDTAILEADTPEERAYYRKHARTVENGIEDADKFIAGMEWCKRTNQCYPACDFRGPAVRNALDIRRGFKSIEEKYRWWRLVRPPTCGFVER